MSRQPSRYADIALMAARQAASGEPPVVAWQRAAAHYYPDSLSSQVKGCPKGVFLGLASSGHIKGIAAGEYTRSVKNRHYAETALYNLGQDPKLAQQPDALWQLVAPGVKPNCQIAVVLALWQAQLLAG